MNEDRLTFIIAACYKHIVDRMLYNLYHKISVTVLLTKYKQESLNFQCPRARRIKALAVDVFVTKEETCFV